MEWWANTVYTGWETEAISGGCCIKCIGTEIDRLVGLLAYCNECQTYVMDDEYMSER